MIALFLAFLLVMSSPSLAHAGKKPNPNYVPAVSVQTIVENVNELDQRVIVAYYGNNTSATVTEASGNVLSLNSGQWYVPDSVNHNYRVDFTAHNGYVFRPDQAAVAGMTLTSPSTGYVLVWFPFIG
jgi:hypothetical protein